MQAYTEMWPPLGQYKACAIADAAHMPFQFDHQKKLVLLPHACPKCKKRRVHAWPHKNTASTVGKRGAYITRRVIAECLGCSWWSDLVEPKQVYDARA